MLLTKTAELPTARDRPARTRRAPGDGREPTFVSGHPLKGPYPEGFETAIFGMGCFWGVERVFWSVAGRLGDVGRLFRAESRPIRPMRRPAPAGPGHAEVVKVVFDPSVITYGDLLKAFWENHDPTQGHAPGE